MSQEAKKVHAADWTVTFGRTCCFPTNMCASCNFTHLQSLDSVPQRFNQLQTTRRRRQWLFFFSPAKKEKKNRLQCLIRCCASGWTCLNSAVFFASSWRNVMWKPECFHCWTPPDQLVKRESQNSVLKVDRYSGGVVLLSERGSWFKLSGASTLKTATELPGASDGRCFSCRVPQLCWVPQPEDTAVV